MAKRSIRYPAMGDRFSRHEGDQRDFHTEYDSFDTEYDSTWEDDKEDIPEAQFSEFNIPWPHSAHRKTYAAKDMQNFRKMFQEVNCDDTAVNEELDEVCDQRDDCIPNLLFYQNKMKSRPDGVSIEEFHKKWYHDYSRLEWVHSYIQWLFPIQEQGMNYDSQPLTPEEIKLFRKDDPVKGRLLKSYKLMLDFYGIKLLDEETGEVGRAENWQDRFKNLDRNTHNNLRITRILKCLGILGFQHYQAPLVKFFLTETLVNRSLPRVKQSVLDYFMFSVLDKSERKQLIRFAFEKFEPKEEFVWCPKRIQRRFLKEIKSKKAETPETHPPKSEPSEGKTENAEAPNASTAQNVQNGENSGVGKADTNQSGSTGTNNNMDIGSISKISAQQSDRDSEKLHAIHKSNSECTGENMENQEKVCGPAAIEEFAHHNSGEHNKDSEHIGHISVSGPVSNKDPSESEPSEGKEIQPENGEAPNASTAQNVQNGENSGVEKETDTNQKLMMLNDQENLKKQLSLKPDKPDKDKEELVAHLQCNNNKAPIPASGDNAEKMSVNERSGSTGTDNKMDIGCSSAISAKQSDEDSEKLHAVHQSNSECTDESMETDPPNQIQDCDLGATEESTYHNSSEDSKDSEHTGHVGVSGPASNKDPSESESGVRWPTSDDF
ncbi:opioid growth factor receptor-like protein 1 [Colossoma macropomum]|uniref:opioid growth factor receptor-like protein 1 n=1 Tax=Colossoma macropomum TaxID=42526 RepID=UPI00186485DC|nr:opioid growth factor receptor-like protein 1 [Colossoma macropomum]